jgi:hypothetical protein
MSVPPAGLRMDPATLIHVLQIMTGGVDVDAETRDPTDEEIVAWLESMVDDGGES